MFGLTYFSANTFAQVIKNKIGYSTWYYKDKVIADSDLTFIMSYDSAGRLKMEHRILRDTSGNAIDSIYSKIDTFGRYYFYKDINSQHFIQYDSLGEIRYSKYNYSIDVETNKVAEKEIIQNHLNEYNEKGKIIRSTISSNNEYSVDQVTTYNYFGQWRIEKKEYVKSYIRKNSSNKITYHLTIISSPVKSNNELKWSYLYKRNKYNDVKKFKEKRDGKNYKTTQSFYKKQKEIRREEEFCETGIRVVTFFEYLYY